MRALRHLPAHLRGARSRCGYLGYRLATGCRRELRDSPDDDRQNDERHEYQGARRDAPARSAGGAGRIGLFPVLPIVPLFQGLWLFQSARSVGGLRAILGAGCAAQAHGIFPVAVRNCLGAPRRIGPAGSAGSAAFGGRGVSEFRGAPGRAVQAVHEFTRGARRHPGRRGGARRSRHVVPVFDGDVFVGELGESPLGRGIFPRLFSRREILKGSAVVGGHARHTPTLGLRARLFRSAEKPVDNAPSPAGKGAIHRLLFEKIYPFVQICTACTRNTGANG